MARGERERAGPPHQGSAARRPTHVTVSLLIVRQENTESRVCFRLLNGFPPPPSGGHTHADKTHLPQLITTAKTGQKLSRSYSSKKTGTTETMSLICFIYSKKWEQN